jgi:hypothetical protein
MLRFRIRRIDVATIHSSGHKGSIGVSYQNVGSSEGTFGVLLEGLLEAL